MGNEHQEGFIAVKTIWEPCPELFETIQQNFEDAVESLGGTTVSLNDGLTLVGLIPIDFGRMMTTYLNTETGEMTSDYDPLYVAEIFEGALLRISGSLNVNGGSREPLGDFRPY